MRGPLYAVFVSFMHVLFCVVCLLQDVAEAKVTCRTYRKHLNTFTGLQYNCPTSHYNDLASLYFSQPTETIRKVGPPR